MIKLFRQESYTKELMSIRNSLPDFSSDILYKLKTTEFVRDYIYSSIVKDNNPVAGFVKSLIKGMQKNDIVAYHCTRILHSEEILKLGLIFSDERYISSLKCSMMEVGVSDYKIDKVISLVLNELARLYNRRDEVCFFFDMDYYKEFDKFLAVYGGELLEFGLSSISDEKSIYDSYKDVITIGKPYVVEFFIPFTWLNISQQEDIACYMLEDWIYTDLRNEKSSHKYGGRIEKEIPPQNIIKIHEMKDNFSNVYDSIF